MAPARGGHLRGRDGAGQTAEVLACPLDPAVEALRPAVDGARVRLIAGGR